MTVRIVGATIRDLTYIASSLRPEDRAEVDALIEFWTPAHLALSALQGPAFVALLDGNPEAAFGCCEQRKGLWCAWSWGRRRMWRCVPAMTRFVHEVIVPDVAEKGAWRVEARAVASNDLAHRWLRKLGAEERCRLPNYGIDGSDFILFDWTRELVLEADGATQDIAA